tara:strand:+ start:82 stop:264 length:183 start_codon:yes stop_codon:yes gene_type:complete
MKQNETIQAKDLSHTEVLHIVREWYTDGMFGDILQDEQGRDLEEVIERELDSIDNINKKQ